MEKISKFKIYISSCLMDGNAFLKAQEQLEESIQEELSNISGLQFKGIYSNIVRGSHNSFSLIVGGMLYDYKQLQLEILVKFALSRIVGLFFSEVRIEHERTWHTITETASIIKERYGFIKVE